MTEIQGRDATWFASNQAASGCVVEEGCCSRGLARHLCSRSRRGAEIAKVGLDESILLEQLERCCRLLTDAQQHYLAGTPSIRRDLNQAVFDRIFVCDDDIVGSDLTTAFSMLLWPSLEADLRADARQVRTGRVRTSTSASSAKT